MATDDAEPLKSAEYLYQQSEYLLNDEISYAASLRDARKTASGLLIIIIGIGLFRFEMFRAPGTIPTVPVWASAVIRVLFVFALGLLGAGGYWIYTERPMWKELRRTEQSGGSALSVLHLDAPTVKRLELTRPVDVLLWRTSTMRLAYERLRERNRRVRRRIAGGMAFVFTGFVLVFAAFVLYTVTVRFSG